MGVNKLHNFYSKANFGQKPFKFPPPDGFQPLNLSTTQPEKVIARPDQCWKYSRKLDQQKHMLLIPTRLDMAQVKRCFDAFFTDSVRGKNSYLVSNTNAAAGTFPVEGE